MSGNVELSTSNSAQLQPSRQYRKEHIDIQGIFYSFNRNVPPLMRINAPQQLSRNAPQSRRQGSYSLAPDICIDSLPYLEMSSSVPLSMSSNAALNQGRSAARCLSRTAKLSGSTSALAVVVAMGEVEEVADGRGARLLVSSRTLSVESLEEATMEEEEVDMVATQEGMEEAVVDAER